MGIDRDIKNFFDCFLDMLDPWITEFHDLTGIG